MFRVLGLLGVAFFTLAAVALLNPPKSLPPELPADQRKRDNSRSPGNPGTVRSLYLAQFSLN
jgi:hypothetical protein